MKSVIKYSVAFLAMSTVFATAGAGQELDVEVGIDAGGRLAVAPFDFGTTILDPVDPGNPFGLQGFAGENPGWAAEGAPEGLNALEDGSNIAIEILSLSSALRMFDPDAGLAEIHAGEQWVAGGPEFDAHPLWLIDNSDPAFNPNQGDWPCTFRLVDLGTTGYQPSEVYTLNFGIPEPGTALLLIPGMLLYSLRRRSN